MRGVAAKAVDPLDWLAMGAALLALVFSFFGYFSYHATAAERAGECSNPSDVPAEARGLAGDLCSGTTAGAWHGFFGWFGVLLGLGAAALVAYAVFVRHAGTPLRARRLAFGAAGLAVLSTLVALLVVPDWPALRSAAASVGASYSRSQYSRDIANGHAFSYWVVLAVLVVLAAVTFLQVRRSASPTATGDPPFAAATPAAPPAGPPVGAPAGYGAPQAPPPTGYRPAWQTPAGAAAVGAARTGRPADPATG